MNIAIIGLGLIGGSIARGLAESGFAACIYGEDTDELILDLALERRVIQGRLNAALHGPEIHLWIFAVPPQALRGTFELFGPYINAESVITDTLSVKKTVYDEVPEQFRARFVGGHPMAGRREIGLPASRPDLFVGMPWILCPDGADEDARRRVTQFVHALDALPVEMSPQAHDAHVALLSHLPHAIANLLVGLSQSLPHPEVAGPSWRDATRVAGSHPELWQQILCLNKQEVISSLRTLQGEIDHLVDRLENGESEHVKNLIEGRPWKP